MNTWPDGIRKPLTPAQHDAWNRVNYPGTTQCCCSCGDDTDRCEDDSIYVEDENEDTIGPLCLPCYRKIKKGS